MRVSKSIAAFDGCLFVLQTFMLLRLVERYPDLDIKQDILWVPLEGRTLHLSNLPDFPHARVLSVC